MHPFTPQCWQEISGQTEQCHLQGEPSSGRHACDLYLNLYVAQGANYIQGRTGSTLGPRATIVVGAPHSVLGMGGGPEVVGPRALLPIWPVRP